MTIQNVSNINPPEGNSMYALVSANSERSMDLVSKTVGTMQEQFQEKMSKLKSLEDRVTSLEDARKKAIEVRNQQRQELTQFVQSIHKALEECHREGCSLNQASESDPMRIKPKHEAKMHYMVASEMQEKKAAVVLSFLTGKDPNDLEAISILDREDLLMLVDIAMDRLRLFSEDPSAMQTYHMFPDAFNKITLSHYRQLADLEIDSKRYPQKIQKFKEIDPVAFQTNKVEYLSKLLIREAQRMSSKKNPLTHFYHFFGGRVNSDDKNNVVNDDRIIGKFAKDRRYDTITKSEPYTNAMLLVLMGANVNYQDEYGMTPMHHAALKARRAIKFFETLGGNSKIKDTFNQTAIEASNHGRLSILGIRYSRGYPEKLLYPIETAFENKRLVEDSPLCKAIPDSFSREDKAQLKKDYDLLFQLGSKEKQNDLQFIAFLNSILTLYHTLGKQRTKSYGIEYNIEYNYAFMTSDRFIDNYYPYDVALKMLYRDPNAFLEDRTPFLSQLLCESSRMFFNPENPLQHRETYQLNKDDLYPWKAMNALQPYLEVMLLLFMGADINFQDYQGWTPLHYLQNHHYAEGNPGATAFFIELGANPELTNPEGKRPRDLAMANPPLDMDEQEALRG